MLISYAALLNVEPHYRLGLKEDAGSGSNRSFGTNNDWIEVHRRRRNLSDRLHLKRVRRFGFSAAHTGCNNPDSSRCRLEGRLQTHKFHLLVLHYGSGNELHRRRLKHGTLSRIETGQTASLATVGAKLISCLQVSVFLLCLAQRLLACWRICFLG